MNTQDFEIENKILIRYRGKGSSAVSPRKTVHVSIPDGVIKIGVDAFYNCKNLKYINLPESLTEIEDYAFQECTALEDIMLPEQIQRLGTAVFPRNLKLKQFPDGFLILNHILYEYLGSDKIVKIPEGVTHTMAQSVNNWGMPVEQVIFPESIQTFNPYTMIMSEETKSITWKGIQIFLAENILYWREAIELAEYIRYFLQNPDHKKSGRFLRRREFDMLSFLEDQVFQEILHTRRIYSDQDIDKYIRFTIENQYYIKQVILTDYKYQYCDFTETGENLKL
ncbi:MAG: leucine-rich repeat domain-containing protein [Oscillospiraceae bacterium]|nr:leucine-rich repeat domain-containing protein [Oscillospiraceae bacterium]